MITISTEQAKDLRNAFECWQEDYDPVEDKEQYDMFGLGVLAMDELLALRKEWERSESIIKAAEKLVRCKGRYHSEQNYRALAALFGVTTPDLPPMEIDTAPPATDKVAKTAFCPKCGNTGLADSGGVQPWGEPILIECDCTFPPAPGADDDSLPFDPQIAEYEQMMEAEQAATDTTSQQFAALAGKAVGGSEGFECTPVADLYELLTKCGECYDYTTSAKVAADWIKEGYSAREYVKLDRLQEALIFASPEPCK